MSEKQPMKDPELRDLKCEWVRLPGSPDWMRHLHIAQTHGNNTVTELWLTEKQAAAVGEVYNSKRLQHLCECGHSLELHDDQAVCRALVNGTKSCQCMQFNSEAATP